MGMMVGMGPTGHKSISYSCKIDSSNQEYCMATRQLIIKVIIEHCIDT